MPTNKTYDNLEFQSTLPRGERRYTDAPPEWLGKFQSTLPRGERRCSVFQYPQMGDFNPRSREGSDDVRPPVLFIDQDISIHAPARGATGCIA